MQPQSKFEKVALRFTKWIGSSSSIVIHTIIFIACFVSVFLGVDFNSMLLVLTTVVSLEAIYLAIFIQLSVNTQSASIQDVAEDIDEIQEDIDEIQEDVDEIQVDVEEGALVVDDVTLGTIITDLKKLMEDVEKLKQQKNDHAKL